MKRPLASILAFCWIAWTCLPLPAEPVVQSLYDRVDAVTFQSNVLGANKEFCVVLPEGYSAEQSDWPVVFLLHGRGRNDRSLIDDATARATLLSANFVTVMPDGDSSWWIDSPAIPASRYETYLEEVISLAEGMYGLSTQATKRGLTGWSMGGYGSTRFAERHAEQFSVISPIIGLLDYPKDPNAFPSGQSYPVRDEFGDDETLWPLYNPINDAESLRGMDIQLITGVDAFDRTMNENFHNELTRLGIEHQWRLFDRSVGFDVSHSFEMVVNSLPTVVSFVEDSFVDTTTGTTVLSREGVGGYAHLASGVRQRLDGGDRALGANTEMLVGSIASGQGASRCLFDFPLDAVPDGATITDVALTLTLKRADIQGTGVEQLELRLSEPSESMVETEVSWNEIRDGLPWTEGGGDPAATVLATLPGYTANGDLTPGQTVTFDATPEFLAAVRAAASGDGNLELVVLSPDTEVKVDTEPRNFIGFYSDDESMLDYRPLLKLVYETRPSLPGDLGGDGFVGGDDLDIVRSFWGQTVPAGDLLSGDPSGDGFVGGDDLDIVRANWGSGTPPAPSAVPEPSAGMGLLGILLVWFFAKCMLRRKTLKGRGTHPDGFLDNDFCRDVRDGFLPA